MTEHGRRQYAVIATIASALKKAGSPSMDERLKAIIAKQVGDLLKGHYDYGLIRQTALNLAATDPQKLPHLGAHVRLAQETLDYDEKQRRQLEERRDHERGLPDLDLDTVIAEFEKAGIDVPYVFRRAQERRREMAKGRPKKLQCPRCEEVFFEEAAQHRCLLGDAGELERGRYIPRPATPLTFDPCRGCGIAGPELRDGVCTDCADEIAAEVAS